MMIIAGILILLTIDMIFFMLTPYEERCKLGDKQYLPIGGFLCYFCWKFYDKID